MLKFLPDTKLTVISEKNPDEVLNFLKSYLDNKTSYFEGNILGYDFHIKKRVGNFEKYYLRWSRPNNNPTFTIQGNIAKHPLGSEIILKIKPMREWVVGIGVLLFFLYGIFKGIIFYNNYFWILFLLPVVFLSLIIWLLAYYEVDEIKMNLKKLFKNI